uniref:Protein transport protein SEC31 homolog B-like isoform X2 n=1 Tax=Tanacetum cinerariifolium TaxID=118510 RepID=A0A6L2NY30_TANCI|nr:protein transport protein SEC31 homolog B-like isoform X2 [Tanacetum cinerariifolium]
MDFPVTEYRKKTTILLLDMRIWPHRFCNDERDEQHRFTGSDLRPKEAKTGYKWHPDFATQLNVASNDDSSPSLRIWDMRIGSFDTGSDTTLGNYV